MDPALEPVAPPRPPLLHRVTQPQLQVLDLVIAGIILVVAVGHLARPSGAVGAPRTALLAMWALAAAAIALRRRVPLVALVGMTGSLALGMGTLRTGAWVFLIAPLMYQVAATGRRRHSLAALGAELVVLAALGVSGGPQRDWAAGAAVIALAFWFVGDSVRVRRVYVAGLAEQAAQRQREALERAQRSVAEERLQIARELHDVVAHSLSVIAVQSGVGHHVIDGNVGEAKRALAAVEETSRAALDELRRMLGVLRGGSDTPAELLPAPGVAGLPRLVDQIRATGVDVELDVASVLSRSLSPAADLSVYRIVQEALTNVVKHAGPARAQVLLHDEANMLVVEVLDDGLGALSSHPAPASPSEASSHHGLVGMRERVTLFGGSFAAGPRDARGFQVVARFPSERVLAA